MKTHGTARESHPEEDEEEVFACCFGLCRGKALRGMIHATLNSKSLIPKPGIKILGIGSRESQQEDEQRQRSFDGLKLWGLPCFGYVCCDFFYSVSWVYDI